MEAYLGIDAGSVTTKLAVLDKNDGLVNHLYLLTQGKPIDTVQQGLKQIKQQLPKDIDICGVATTGSARYLAGVIVGADLVKNEITSHAVAALQYNPQVQTIIEIGGQDSKFISFQGGIPIDYAMNEGCSAGTGSFLEESASVDMKIPVEKISSIAETSKNPIAFGERCAAFINSDLRNALQQGAKKEDVVAGLVYSIADNYISRIVGPRFLGETILFLGGVALNKAVGLALGARSKRKVVVPAHPELMGAIGSALMTLDLLREGSIQEGLLAVH